MRADSKKASGCASPDAVLAYVVEDVEQRVDILGLEASAEIASGGRIGNARGSEGVEEDLVLAAQFEILQTGAVAERVVGQVEDVVGFVIGKMKLEQMEPLVDGVDEAEPAGEEMDGTDAAVCDAAIAEGELVMDVGGGEARLFIRIDVEILDGFGLVLVEAAQKTALAASPMVSYLGVHSKLPFRTREVVWLLLHTSRKSLEFRVFSILRPAECCRLRLFKA